METVSAEDRVETVSAEDRMETVAVENWVENQVENRVENQVETVAVENRVENQVETVAVENREETHYHLEKRNHYRCWEVLLHILVERVVHAVAKIFGGDLFFFSS